MKYLVFRRWIQKMNLCSFILGVLNVAQCNFRLPLRLVCFPAQPSKAANHKLTIDTNKPPISFLTIFPGKSLILSIIGDVSATSTGIACLSKVMRYLTKLMLKYLKSIFEKKLWNNISIIGHLGQYICLWQYCRFLYTGDMIQIKF